MRPFSTKNQFENLNSFDTRLIRKKNERKKVKLLAIIAILILALIGIVTYAAIQQGGFSNLLKGEQNPLKNIFQNVENNLTGATPTPVPYNKPLTIPTVSATQIPDLLVPNDDRKTNLLLTAGVNNYQATVSKDVYIVLTNSTSASVVLEFSDDRQIKLMPSESKSVIFKTAGIYTFKDIIDNSSTQIRGTFKVLE